MDNHEAIDILITATENSLYINRYTIEYEAAPPTCYTVSFVTGLDSVPASITQSAIGAPIVLPMWRDTAGWYFQGWSEIEITGDTLLQEWLGAGSEYVPKINTYLWAVYSDVNEVTAVTDYASGQYVMGMWNEVTAYYANSGMAMKGNVRSGEVALHIANMMRNNRGKYHLMTTIEDDMIYELDFDTDSTLSILHVETEDTIGYMGTKLNSKSDGKWRYKLLDDNSLAVYFVTENKDTYVLYVDVSMASGEMQPVIKAKRMNMQQWTNGGWLLFPILYPQYTSWPFGKPDIKEDEDSDDASSVLSEGQYLMNIGRYRLYVKDGKKYLFL